MERPVYVQPPSFWARLYDVYSFVKFCIGGFFLLWFAWSFIDLFGPPILKQILVEPFRPAYSFPKTPEELARPEPDAAMIEIQRHCRHIDMTHGLRNFYCPICRKKLLPGRSPWCPI